MTRVPGTAEGTAKSGVIDLFVASSWDPAPFYKKMRESRIVHFPELGLWLVSHYDDVRTVLRDTDRFGAMPSNMMGEVPEEFVDELPGGYYGVWQPALINVDPPTHTRIRKLAQRPLTYSALKRHAPMIRAVANELIDRFVDSGRADVVGEFTEPLPMIVMSNIVGVPAEDREDFKRWTSGATELFSPALSPERRRELAEEQVAFTKYVLNIIEERRKNPGEDLISQLILAQEVGEKSLDDLEVLGVISQLIIAGFETTNAAMAFALLFLCKNPGIIERVRADSELISNVIDETLRRVHPVRGVVRHVKRDTELAGVELPKGARLMAVIGAAHHDPERFEDPERFDVDRPTSEVRAALPFGQGVHMCIGAPLARTEMPIALTALLERLPNLRLACAEEDLEVTQGMIFRGLKTLTLEWDA